MKFRGQKRYYQNLAIKNDLTNLNLDGWFNMWHRHFDISGLGDDSFKRRLPHLDKWLGISILLKIKFAIP